MAKMIRPAEFFKALFQNTTRGKINLRYLPSKRNLFLTLDQLEKATFPQNENAYFAPATRNGGGRKEDIEQIPALWCDIDFKDTPQEEANELLKHFPLRASAIVGTGGGYHVYWLLKEPEEKGSVAIVEQTLRRLALYFKADMAATDASRILRVPGTLNYKYKKPRPVRLLFLDTSLRYELEDFDLYLPEDEKKAKEKPGSSAVNDPYTIELPKGSFRLKDLTDLVQRGYRDEFVFHVAYCLARGGASENVVRYVAHLISAHCCDLPFPARECEIKIKSALERAARQQGNLSEKVRRWIDESADYFCLRDLYTDLNLTTDSEKATARIVVKELKDQGHLEPGSRQGTYRKRANNFTPVDVANAPEDCLPLRLPFGLENYVNINRKDLIVIAGSPNAGKTALMLELVRLNMERFTCHYFSTEMGATACKRRLIKHKDLKPSDWNWYFYDAVPNFEDIIQPDDLTFIDYVEEVQGDAYKIPGILAKIQRRLRNGVAIVALQKKSGASYAIGGEMTRAKPSLFLGVDSEPPGNRLTVYKAKDFSGPNPNGMSIKFKILDGINLIKTGTWEPA